MIDIPEGYTLLDGYFDKELRVTLKDLVYNPTTKEWCKPKVYPFRTVGIVADYFYVARREN